MGHPLKLPQAAFHQVDAARYGAMSRPGASPIPRPEDQEPDDPRAALLWRYERKHDTIDRGRYAWT